MYGQSTHMEDQALFAVVSTVVSVAHGGSLDVEPAFHNGKPIPANGVSGRNYEVEDLLSGRCEPFKVCNLRTYHPKLQSPIMHRVANRHSRRECYFTIQRNWRPIAT